MKLQITVLALDPMVSTKGNKYGNAQVIFHDEKVTAGPCRIFGDLYLELEKNFAPNQRYEATLTLQPDAQGTRVQIDKLELIKAAKPAMATA